MPKSSRESLEIYEIYEDKECYPDYSDILEIRLSDERSKYGEEC